MNHGQQTPSALAPSWPNAEQIRYWNDVSGPKWVALQEKLSSHLRPFGARALERAALTPGDRVIDVGCGCGETTIEIARRVGPRGAVTGIDVSTVMLAQAVEAVRAAGLDNVALENVDAQTAALPDGAFDVLFSRFGLMFFIDPEAAFANLRRALRPGARLAFVCWRALAENAWMRVPGEAVAQHVELQRPLPGAPGPFAFADPGRLRALLEGASFGDVALEAVDEPALIGGGGTLDEAVEFLLQIGPAAMALREASAEKQAAATLAIREALVPYQTSDGVRMDAAVWIVTASAR